MWCHGWRQIKQIAPNLPSADSQSLGGVSRSLQKCRDKGAGGRLFHLIDGWLQFKGKFQPWSGVTSSTVSRWFDFADWKPLVTRWRRHYGVQQIVSMVADVVHDSRLNRRRNQCEAFSWSRVNIEQKSIPYGAGFGAVVGSAPLRKGPFSRSSPE